MVKVFSEGWGAGARPADRGSGRVDTLITTNLLNTLRIRASSGAILLPPIPDRGTHCDGCDRGYVRVASRADNGSRIDDSPTSLTDTAIRPPSLSYLKFNGSPLSLLSALRSRFEPAAALRFRRRLQSDHL